ncbi:MAG: hypothetical protein LBC09_07115 [Helicobacteraceae bacterium]|jgi:hypothetical protein|nr:hypothetical protein [Helicobacteraceae bacterium]
MQNGIKLLKDFVEGAIDAASFEKSLYENSDLEALLSGGDISWRGTYLEKTTPYLYLLEQNYGTITGVINALGAVALFLKKRDIPFEEKGQNYERLEQYELILSAQPQYIDADMAFIEKYILPEIESGTKSEMKRRIKEKFNDRFKYQDKPPKWIQNPQWLIKNETPLYFLGQIEIKQSKLFHDNGYLYIFIDQNTKAIETIVQLY